MGLVSFRRFKEMLDETATGWERTKPYDKYNDNDEARYQSQSLKRGDFSAPDHVHKQLEHLSNSDNYRKALQHSKVETYTHAKFKERNTQNTDAGQSWERTKRGMDPGKRARAEQSGIKKSPIILRHKESGYEHLLAGNTRASSNQSVKAQVIEY